MITIISTHYKSTHTRYQIQEILFHVAFYKQDLISLKLLSDITIVKPTRFLEKLKHRKLLMIYDNKTIFLKEYSFYLSFPVIVVIDEY